MSDPGADPGRARLTYEQVAIDVVAAAPTLAWLVEFLAPAFGAAPAVGAPADRIVEFRNAPGEHADRHREMASARVRSIDAFTLDGSFARHPAWHGVDGRTWAWDDRCDVFFGVADAGRSVSLLVDRDAAYPRVSLMRVVRELATSAMCEAGRLPVHGAAFLHAGGAVVLCGPKRAGKTSLLVHALRCGGAFLSNDRLFVDVDASQPQARAAPTIVMLRDGTLELFAPLRKAFEEARFDRGRTLSECAPGVPRPEPRAGPGFDRPGISPAQLCALLDAPMAEAAPVATLLFPRLDPAADGIALEPLGPAEAGSALEASLLRPSRPARHSELFAPGRAPIPAEREVERCRRLVERVPAYACRLGPRAFESDLLGLLPRAPSTSARPAPPPGSRAR